MIRIQHTPGTRVYISGPMTGLPNHNYEAFNQLAYDLRTWDKFIVLNPAENFGGKQGLDRKEYMRIDLCHLLQAEVVVLLPGWVKSKGAKLEVTIAKELGLPIWHALTNGNFEED